MRISEGFTPRSELMPEGDFKVPQPEKIEKRKGAAKEFADNMVADIQPFIDEAKSASPEDIESIAQNMGTHLSLNYWAPADHDKRELILNTLKSLRPLSAQQREVLDKAVAVMEKTTIIPFKESETSSEDDDTDGNGGGVEQREAA